MSEFDEIDKISLNQRYLIDYSNLKDGFIKNQNSFADKSKLNFFLKNNHLGIPLVLPENENCFKKKGKKFNINTDIIRNKIFFSNKNYPPLENFFKFGYNFYSDGKPKKRYNKVIKKISNINLKTKSLINYYKKKGKILGSLQTRNIPHFGHEKIIELLLKKCDIVFINPVIGPKKKGDISTKKLCDIYNFFVYSSNNKRIIFSPICANMFYAGPREAVHHALLRQSFGFDYFIVGRDHAGAHNQYKKSSAINLIKKIKKKLNIKIITHKGAAYCKVCKKTQIIGNCGHSSSSFENISGTVFRDHLRNKKIYKYANYELQKYIHRNNIRV